MVRETSPAIEQQLVLFDLDSGHYAIDSRNVREIIRIQTITKVPGAPMSVEGVINLRGKVTPVLDLRKKLGLPAGDENKGTRIVVVEVEGQDVGLIVDGVSEVLRIPVSVIEPTSTIAVAEGVDYILGVANLGEKLVILLDIRRLLGGGEKQRQVGGKGDGQALAGMTVA